MENTFILKKRNLHFYKQEKEVMENKLLKESNGKLESYEKKVDELDENIPKKIRSFLNGNDKSQNDFLIQKKKYQLGILERSIEKEMVESEKYLKGLIDSSMNDGEYVNVKNYLQKLFRYGTFLEFYKEDKFPLLFPHNITIVNGKMSDFQFDSSMIFGKLLGINPRIIANRLIERLNQMDLFIIKDLSCGGPGFVNININHEWLMKQIQNLVLNDARPCKTEKSLKYVVDLSSPNIAKEMHVGHLRSTIIGDSICRLLEACGHEVLRLNHLGDWGTQFGMLVAQLQDEFPNYLNESPSISNLQQFYKQAKKRFDEDEEFKKRSYENVVKVQSYESDAYKAWKLICDVSLTELNKIYDDLEVVIEARGESFYQSMMKDVVKDFLQSNLAIKDEGRLLVWPTDCSIPLTIQKSDGGFTYDTSDLATIRHRLKEEKADAIIYVVDCGQHEHFKGIFKTAQMANWYDPEKVHVEHVEFGLVLGEDRQKFKSRSGDTIRLRDLLNEGLNRAKDKLMEKERDKELSPEEFNRIQRAVAYGCIKYADLSTTRTSNYIFSFDRMLQDTGNTAVYMLYAYARICSIIRTATSREEIVLKAKEQIPKLEEKEEIKLANCIVKFTEVIDQAMKTFYIHPICTYMYEIATTFSEFYHKCYCIEKNGEGEIVRINYDRLQLVVATANVLKLLFKLLGINPLERM
ncbi:hypothetical protein SNEBB_000475 [Seison nebaliae]|nr:hypothetical protein SNEBB_000475 [Seison nebaliae]